MQRTNNTLTTAHLVTSLVLGSVKSLAFIPNITAFAAAAAFWYTIGGMNVSNVYLKDDAYPFDRSHPFIQNWNVIASARCNVRNIRL